MTIWMQMAGLTVFEAVARRAAKDATMRARAIYESEGPTARFAQASAEARKCRSLVDTYFN